MNVNDKDEFDNDVAISGAGGGGKSGGGGSARVAQEDPNTLQSNAVARIIDVIGEGEISGLVNGAKSVFVDGTPLQNDDGSYNFNGIEFQERVGLTVQSHVGGFNGVESTTDVSTEITQNEPVIRTISDLDADAVRVTISLQSLTNQNAENGDLRGSSVDIAIDRRNNGGIYKTIKTDRISGKTTSAYQRAYRIELDGAGPWDIRVRRLTPDSNSSLINDKTYFANYTSIIETKLTYPDTAYIALKVDAQQFGNTIPKTSYLMRGLIVNVPDNYNPINRTYSGIWSGNFKRAYTNNPAWIFYDLATNTRYGAGLSNVDKWSLYQIGRYCDEYVDDGYGSTEPRFTINTVLNSRDDVFKVLQSLSTAFRGMTYYGAGTVTAVQDAPATASRLFNNSNVVDGEFKRSDSDIRTRHTRVAVSWNDPTDNYKLTTELVDDNDAIQKYGIQTSEISAFGCTSRGQARRLGLWTLYTEQLETESVEFSVSIADADVRPGDIISINDAYHVGARIGGRLKSNNTTTELYLDKHPDNFTGSNKTISLQMPNGIPVHKAISSINNGVVTLAESLNQAPLDNAVYTLSSSDVASQEFRVLAIVDNDDQTYTISALEHNKNKYALVEQGLTIPDSPTTLLPSGKLSAPLSLSVETYKYLEGGTEHQAATLGWTPSGDPRVKSYIAEMLRPDSASYETIGATKTTSIDIRNVSTGEYTFRVASVNSLGARSEWSLLTTTLQSLLLPVAPTSVDVDAGLFNVTLIPNSSRAGQLYEFYRSSVALTSDTITANANFLGRSTTLADNNLQFNTTYFYYIRGFNAYGVSEFYPVQVTTDNSPAKYIDVLTGEIRESHLYQSLNEEIEKISGPESLVDSVAYKVAQAKAETETFIVTVENTLKDADTALAERIDVLSANFDDNTAIIQSEQQARADADDALAQQINSVQTQVDDTITVAISSLESQIVTVDDKTTANAQAITNVQTEFNDTLATVQQDFNTEIIQLDDKIENTSTALTTAQSTFSDEIASVQTELETQIINTSSFVFRESFKDSLENWTIHEGTAETSVVETDLAKRDGKLLSIGNNAGNDELWVYHNTAIPFYEDVLYKIKVRMRKPSGGGRFYAGLEGLSGDGVTLVNMSGADSHTLQHYIAANNVLPTADFTEYVGYVKGTAAAGSFTNKSFDKPAVMHENVRFIRPVLICNYSDAAGTMEIDYFEIESISENVEQIGAQYTAKVDVNGLVGGFGLYNDGETIDAGFNVDKFYIGRNLENQVAPFIVNNNQVIIDDALINSLLFTKLRSDDDTLIFENGKLSAAHIDVDSLVVSKGQSKNFVNGQSGWQLTETGGQINFPITFGGSLDYADITGTKPPTNADNTGSNVAYDTARVSGHSASGIASAAIHGRDRANQWTRPGTTLINGNRIYTGDAYVDTLQIRGNAITVPSTYYAAGRISLGWTGTAHLGGINFNSGGAPITIIASVYVSGPSNGGTVTVRLKRGGSVLREITTSDNALGSFDVSIGLGAVGGTHNYSLEMSTNRASVGATSRLIHLLGTKR